MKHTIIKLDDEMKKIYSNEIINLKIRKIDKLEIKQFKISTKKALKYSLNSKHLWAIFNNKSNKIDGIFGLNTIGNENLIFLLASEKAFDNPYFLLYNNSYMVDIRNITTNFCVYKPVETTNEQTIKWLKFLGLEQEGDIITDINNIKFYKFKNIKINKNK